MSDAPAPARVVDVSLYPSAIIAAREVARSCGYAIGVHGSQKRDLDLIAAPWTPRALAPFTLARRIAASCGGKITYQDLKTRGFRGKPHGRVCFVIHLPARGAYIDLSIMPRKGRA